MSNVKYLYEEVTKSRLRDLVDDLRYENHILEQELIQRKSRESKLFKDIQKEIMYLWRLRNVNAKDIVGESYKIKRESLKSFLKVLDKVIEYKEERDEERKTKK